MWHAAKATRGYSFWYKTTKPRELWCTTPRCSALRPLQNWQFIRIQLEARK